ncbi:radical SAM family heme chaperone HemW [Anaerovorax odorimutans]|uniref:Heme chaperone HemW n=2 Tax=Anaerovorax odorimutans TaxID=109327 RepID=A0ABT1RMT5_9FIRM|nr:radical SAM family heme chaperone HemW [Anaerovorax odorimutans]
MKINRKKGPAGLYIHIPFCVKKCGYCDFLSFGECDEEIQKKYAESLIAELSLYRGQNIKCDTIFIGGGTPSLLRQEHIAKILEAAEAAFCVAEKAEVSLEANPGTLSRDKLRAYRKAGVNRLSIGVQSMDDGMLSFMGRIHSSRDFTENFQAAREAGFSNINVDLMFGMPGQSRQMWRDSLEQVLALEPEHISFYSLQLEEGTTFSRMYREGSIDLPPAEEDRAMYHEGIRMLREAGYHHYEISNCAKPGFECQHNLKYWSFDEYYGAGLGAHAFLYDKGRSCNVSDFDAYFQKIGRGELPADPDGYSYETQTDLMGEYVFTALRKTEGLDMEDFRRTFGENFFSVYEDQRQTIRAYVKSGHLALNGTYLALTEKGIDISNEIMAEFV